MNISRIYATWQHFRPNGAHLCVFLKNICLYFCTNNFRSSTTLFRLHSNALNFGDILNCVYTLTWTRSRDSCTTSRNSFPCCGQNPGLYHWNILQHVETFSSRNMFQSHIFYRCNCVLETTHSINCPRFLFSRRDVRYDVVWKKLLVQFENCNVCIGKFPCLSFHSQKVATVSGEVCRYSPSEKIRAGKF